MVFTWVVGIISIICSSVWYGGAPSLTDVLLGFIFGALIDLYNLIKEKGK
ncbi:hypothetical protein [Bacillus sp. AK128]